MTVLLWARIRKTRMKKGQVSHGPILQEEFVVFKTQSFSMEQAHQHADSVLPGWHELELHKH